MCKLVADPADTCCQKLVCNGGPGGGTPLIGGPGHPVVPSIYSTIDPHHFNPNTVRK